MKKSVRKRATQYLSHLSLILLLVSTFVQGGSAFAAPQNDSQVTTETETSLAKTTLPLNEVSDSSADDTLLAEGDAGTSHWQLSNEQILTITGGKLPTTSGSSPWLDYQEHIRKIILIEPVQLAEESSDLFSGLTNLVEIKGIENLQISSSTKLNRFFRGCSSLETLDLSKWDTRGIVENEDLFSGCTKLNKISFGEHSFFQPLKAGSSETNSNIWRSEDSSDTYTNLDALVNANVNIRNQTYLLATPDKTVGKVILQFLDENDQPVTQNKELSGTVGESFDLMASGILPSISGYELNQDKLPDTTKGQFDKEDQSIAFYYKKVDLQKAAAPVEQPTVSYTTHVQTQGWQNSKKDGEISGTVGQSKRLEAIRIKLENTSVSGSIQYRTHIQGIGWENTFKQNNAVSGTSGQSKRLEGIQIKLTGDIAKDYDVYYRVHAQKFGWLGWAKNGEDAGTEGMSYRLEGIQVQLVKKGETMPGPNGPAYHNKPTLSYRTHVQGIGWQGYKTSGQTSGTSGQSKRLEAIQVQLQKQTIGGSIQYRTHIQSIGWESAYAQNNGVSGTSGQSKRLEAIQIRLTGELANHFDIYYRVHAQNFGWLGWAKNGENAGTEKISYRLEAIQIQLVKKGDAAPGSTNKAYARRPDISYRTHIQGIGWDKYQASGQSSGTVGQSKRLEAIQVQLQNQNISGAIQYRTHIQDIGWENGFVQNNGVSGTSGQSKRLEAIQIQLTGELATHFDVYYRVHAQNFGWLGWAKNGASAGTEGYSYRLESIQIQIVPKSYSAPGSTSNPFIKKRTEIVLENVPYVSQYTPVFSPWGCAGAAMTMLLRSRNISVDLRYVQDNLPMYPKHPGGQKGDVYTGFGFGWVIKPQTLTEYMQRWYPKVRNISGSSTESIINEVLSGKPVLYYGFSSYQVPGDYVRNHCKVIAGYSNGHFLVYDPLYKSPDNPAGSGGKNMNYDLGARHWLPISKFNAEYNKQAIVIDF
ncbi:hypothetical protein NRIC_38270 [Enterococcus florum]|uniref:Peptidase C39-like domain-containing protein n=1 Tax=Enterococcus florum TaxID=2480627 RepID=A0A4P5PDD3_9ENTE|nr:C39 family peptidase [Enterococcus florum]GCF95936.1 hypothetical protein NRIC_38270 [Enterococcus florum]